MYEGEANFQFTVSLKECLRLYKSALKFHSHLSQVFLDELFKKSFEASFLSSSSFAMKFLWSIFIRTKL